MIHEFMRMNPSSFTGLSIIEDLENFVEELKNVFDVMHVVDAERVEIVHINWKNVDRTWFNQWKEGRDKDALHPT